MNAINVDHRGNAGIGEVGELFSEIYLEIMQLLLAIIAQYLHLS